MAPSPISHWLFLRQVGQILHVHVEEAVAGFGNGSPRRRRCAPSDRCPCTGRSACRRAHHFQHGLRGREMFVLRAVVVDGVIRMLYSFTSFHRLDVLLGGCANHHRQARVFAYSNCGRRLSTVVPLVISTFAAAGDLETRGIELRTAGLGFFRAGPDLQVDIFNADPRRLKLLQHFDGGGPIEHAERDTWRFRA